MANWGYRVYTFEMLEGRSTVLMQEIEDHRERLHEIIKLVGRCTRVGKPHSQEQILSDDDSDDIEEAEFDETDPTLSLRCVDYNSEMNAIHASVAMGERGLHDYATNPNDRTDRLNVQNRSAETPMRVDFFFATASKKGFIVAEMVGAKDSIPSLIKWINFLARERRKQQIDEISNADAQIDSDGNKISKSKLKSRVPLAIRIRAQRVADPELLRAIVDDMTSMDATFTGTDVNGKESTYKLTIKVKATQVREGIIKRFRNSKLSPDVIITETLNDLDMDADSLKDANLGVDSMKVYVQSPHGNKTLLPGQLADLFNYKFKSKGHPKTEPYYQTTLDKIAQLSQTAQVALKTPDKDCFVEWVKGEEETWMTGQQTDNE
ncbi:hypothetical protein [Arcanobacterium phocae]|uniref:hypothetical protein n=1 Tax=Arcanobacterium phocae TaxID=131112 RepID=UPI001C0EFCBA|nr:hypothetical protein [Arcanobacterium phocae]